MVESPFMTMAGEQPSLRKKTPVAKSPFWESLGENLEGISGVPTYWHKRNKYLKELAEKHGMWLVHQNGRFILTWKDRKGKPDIYSSKNLWDVLHKMKAVGKLGRVI
jgi:hypothetical protein